MLSVDFDPLLSRSYPDWFWKEYPHHEIRNTRFLASSVEKLCELAWRWYSIWNVLDSVKLPSRPTENEVNVYFEKREMIHLAVRKEILAIDPSAIGKIEGRYPWADLIREIVE